MPLTPEQLAQMDAAAGLSPQGIGNEALFAQMDAALAETPRKAGTMKSIGQGLQQLATFGLADELQALGAGIGGAINPNKTFAQQYDKRLATKREDIKEAERNPLPYYGTQVAASLVPGIGAAKLGGQTLARLATQAPIRTASGLGALQGAAYGFGSGEGGFGERAGQAGISAGVGALAAPAGAYIGKQVSKLAGKAGEQIGRMTGKNAPNEFVTPDINEIVESTSQRQLAPKVGQEQKAIGKVVEAIKRDYPDNWQQVLRAWQDGDVELSKLGGENVSRLAKGAAQYRSGEAVTKRYFENELPESVDRIRQAVNRNISGQEAFYATADDVLKSGRLKASPIYEKAHNSFVNPKNPIIEKPEIAQAIATARREYPSELDGLPDNSVKVLDYAKRAIDDQIEAAQRQGNNNFARSRVDLKNQLLDELDNVSPDYKKARSISGDYLSVKKAMDDGLNFTNADAELVEKSFKKMSEAEKEAFRIGVGKKIRDTIDKKVGGANPYNAIFGSKDQQRKLMAVLSPEQFTNLEKNLKAEDKLFRLKNEVLGNSSTVSKGMAAAEISDGAGELLASTLGGPKATFFAAARMAIKKMSDGISDDSADSIARILYEKEPAQKLMLLEKTLGSKSLSQVEKQAVKRAYFQAENYLKSRASGATAATTATMPLTDTGE